VSLSIMQVLQRLHTWPHT